MIDPYSLVRASRCPQCWPLLEGCTQAHPRARAHAHTWDWVLPSGTIWNHIRPITHKLLLNDYRFNWIQVLPSGTIWNQVVSPQSMKYNHITPKCLFNIPFTVWSVYLCVAFMDSPKASPPSHNYIGCCLQGTVWNLFLPLISDTHWRKQET